MRRLAALALLIVMITVLPVLAQEQPQAEGNQPPPLLAPDLFDRGVTALNEQDFERAVLDTSLFLLLNPTYSQGYYVRALSYFGLENTAEALNDIDHALSTAPDAPQYASAVYALRAEINSAQQQFEDAIEDYTLAIDLNPAAELFASRALIYLGAGDFEEALDDLDDALSGTENNPVLYIYRAYANTELENTADAAQDYYAFMQSVEMRRIEHDEIPAGEVQFVTLGQGVIHAFQISGNQDELLSIITEARPGDTLDPLLVLLDEDGDVLAANDDIAGTANAAILDFHLPSEATYTILLGHSLGGFEGEVALVYETST